MCDDSALPSFINIVKMQVFPSNGRGMSDAACKQQMLDVSEPFKISKSSCACASAKCCKDSERSDLSTVLSKAFWMLWLAHRMKDQEISHQF